MRSFQHLMTLAFACAPVALCAQELQPVPQPLPVVTPVSHEQVPYAQQLTVMEDNPMLWQQYQALQVAEPQGASGSSCGCGNSWWDRCGCNPEVFPWIDGPGLCDQWCVGPKWQVELEGLFLFTDDVEWDRLQNNLGVTPTLTDQFDHALGARLYVSAYNQYGYGMEVGYMGANDWGGTFTFDPNASSERRFDYDARLNSVEINFLPKLTYLWQFYTGFRYIEIDEHLDDFTTVDKVIPPPVSGGTAPVAYVDSGTSYLVENQLYGFQLGARRDGWRLWRRVFIDSYANAGIYCNWHKRDDITINRSTIITGDDLDTADNEFSIATNTVRNSVGREYAEVAFAGEAGISGVVRLTNCLSVRGGYQVMVVDGIGRALDAFFSNDLMTSTSLYHGMQFGMEYRR